MYIHIGNLTFYGKDFPQALRNLHEVLEILYIMQFLLRIKKFLFFFDKIELLGHEISVYGIYLLDRSEKTIT